MTTAFTRLVGCHSPIQLAPVGGGVGTPELALAVCETGGLGMIHSLDATPLSDRLAWLRDRTAAPYGVGFFGFHLSHLASDLELAAAVSTAEDALTLLASERVDVILLDLEMPGMGGLDALPRLIDRAREARIMVVSSLTADGAEHTVEALALGAADTLQKPASGGFDREYRDKLLVKIRALGRRPLRRASTAEGRAQTPALRIASRERAGIVAIGASTGGIHAIGQLLGALPPDLGIPILITQHLPVSFIPAFVQQLRGLSGRAAFASSYSRSISTWPAVSLRSRARSEAWVSPS